MRSPAGLEKEIAPVRMIGVEMDAAELEQRFEQEVDLLIDAARRACLRLLPWALEEHENIIQEALRRAIDNVRAGKVTGDSVDLAGYVYGVTRFCIQETKRKLYAREVRACALPEDDELVSSLFVQPDEEPPKEDPVDLRRKQLLEALRYYVVHMFATATELKRRQALRDTYILARHYLREVPLVALAEELGLTRRACQYAIDRTSQRLQQLFDPETGEVRSFVENSQNFSSISELTDLLRQTT